jgi:predicted PurR-regulated permease PerM
MPRWVWKAVAIFWLGFLLTVLGRTLADRLGSLLILLLVALFLSLAIEPGVNRLAKRGWRRGAATAAILVGVLAAFLVFVIAIGTLVGRQIADLLGDSEKYVNRTVDFVNDTFGTEINADQVITSINEPDGTVQRFIRGQQGRVVDISVAALGVVLQALSVMLFTFYMVADGPRMRRAICGRLRPERQRDVLDAWELAIDKTGGYIYSRALLAGLSAASHWVVLQALGTRAPLALALWVGVTSQFLPVVGTYIGGALPVLIVFIDSPVKAAIVLVFVGIYQQVENYLLLPRITARTMDLHPAIAFGSAIAGAAVLGAVGAVLAIPAAAMAQAIASNSGRRHEVIVSDLTNIIDRGPKPTRRQRVEQRRAAKAARILASMPRTAVSQTTQSSAAAAPTEPTPTEATSTEPAPTDPAATDGTR